MVKHNNVVPNGHFKKHWQNYVKMWFNHPKAVKIFPMPTAGPLRGQTLKYNMKAARVPKKLAPTIGIAVDQRRRNSSLEGLQANAQRLKTYKAKLVVFPRRVRKFKKPTFELVKLRVERTNEKHFGARLKRVAEAEKEEKK
ncbi:hypothetical protein ACHQM5_015929 [Ranunculus cassubicifolius]